MAHYGRHWAVTASQEVWSGGAAYVQRPHASPIPVSFNGYHYNIGWLPPQNIWNMAVNSNNSTINHHHPQMIDDNLIIDVSISSHTTHQQFIDGHLITDLIHVPSNNADRFSGPEGFMSWTNSLSSDDVRNRNRGGRLSKEVISKHMKTRAATREDNTKICVVCQDDLRDGLIATLDCGHEFHVDCIKRWLREKNICPLCNATAIYQH